MKEPEYITYLLQEAKRLESIGQKGIAKEKYEEVLEYDKFNKEAIFKLNSLIQKNNSYHSDSDINNSTNQPIALSEVALGYYHNKWYDSLILDRQNREKLIPKYDLEQKHIDNLRVLLNRSDLLTCLPKNSICAEIGVDKGEFSEIILNQTKPKKLHLIDAWGDPKRYHDGLKELVRNKFNRQINQNLVELNIGYSTSVLKEFPNYYFDWVYLDTDHTYKVTANELAILKDKVKPNGIIAGHDYIIGNWAGDCRYGVIEAVHELCVKDNWELICITINKNEMPSFAIRRINP